MHSGLVVKNGFIVDGNPSLWESIKIGAVSELDFVVGITAVFGLDVADAIGVLVIGLDGELLMTEEFIDCL